MTDKFVTIEDFAKVRLERFNDLQERFRKHLDTVPDEYKEAVVEDHLDKLVANGWIKKEFRDKLHYNKDYKGVNHVRHRYSSKAR